MSDQSLSFEELAELRSEIRSGALRGERFLEKLERVEPSERDRWLERLLGIDTPPRGSQRPQGDLLGYNPSGVGAVLQLIRELPIGAQDVFVDIGSGLGKVTTLVHLVCGARALGLERNAELVELAKACSSALGLDAVSHAVGDARCQALGGSVYFLYLPFTGAALERAMSVLETETRGRRVTICCLGLDLGRYPWLEAQESSDFWTTIYRRRLA